MGQYWDPIEASKQSMPLTPQMRRDGLTHHMDTTYQAMMKPEGSFKSFDGQCDIDLPTFRRTVPIKYWHLAEEHPFGNPPTAEFEGMWVNLSSIEFAYVVWRLSQWLHSTSSILEIGGGFGGLARVLLNFIPDLDITTVDLAPMLLIQDYYHKHTSQWPWTVKGCTTIPIDQSYDIIIASRVLCELDLVDTNTYLTQIDDHLKPGGIFYCIHHDRCINEYKDWIIPPWEIIDSRPFPFQAYKYWLEKIWRKVS